MWRGAGLGYEDMPVSSVLQMIGRAGRPGFDDRKSTLHVSVHKRKEATVSPDPNDAPTTGGVAVIMTSKDKQSRYEEMSAGQELVESQLTKRLHEGSSVGRSSRHA